MARPSKYKPEFNEQAFKLCLMGATDKELAQFFEVDERTINEWKQSKEGFSQSLKRGKDLADANVGARLYERALGYEHPSEDIKVINDEVVRIPIIKVYPPDTTACIFWLKNRQPAKWRDKQEVSVQTDPMERVRQHLPDLLEDDK